MTSESVRLMADSVSTIKIMWLVVKDLDGILTADCYTHEVFAKASAYEFMSEYGPFTKMENDTWINDRKWRLRVVLGTTNVANKD